MEELAMCFARSGLSDPRVLRRWLDPQARYTRLEWMTVRSGGRQTVEGLTPSGTALMLAAKRAGWADPHPDAPGRWTWCTTWRKTAAAARNCQMARESVQSALAYLQAIVGEE